MAVILVMYFTTAHDARVNASHVRHEKGVPNVERTTAVNTALKKKDVHHVDRLGQTHSFAIPVFLGKGASFAKSNMAVSVQRTIVSNAKNSACAQKTAPNVVAHLMTIITAQHVFKGTDATFVRNNITVTLTGWTVISFIWIVNSVSEIEIVNIAKKSSNVNALVHAIRAYKLKIVSTAERA